MSDLSVCVSPQLTIIRKPGVRPLHRPAKSHRLVGLYLVRVSFVLFAIVASSMERSAKRF